MPRRLLLREGGQSLAPPPGYVTIQSQDGQLQTQNEKGTSQPVSAQGESFVAKGDVFVNELAYLNDDGTVSIPGNITEDDNKADNIIGVFLADAEDGEQASIITKGIITLNSFQLVPRAIYYIDTKGKLTTAVTPYIFGKSLTTEKIAVDISFVQSILNVYGITPTFDKLSADWNSKLLSVNLYWTSEDKISNLEIESIGLTIQYEEAKSSPFLFSLENYIEDYEIINLSFYKIKITNEKNVSSQVSFQVLGGIDDNSQIKYDYSGLGGQYVDGDGLFLDTNIFEKTKIEIFLYSSGDWSFGESNTLPLRKLFIGSFVNKDEKGNYVFDDEQIRLYENEKWTFNKISYVEFDLSYSELETYKQVESSLSSTYWNATMKFYSNDKTLTKGSTLFYKTKKEEYVKLPSFEATFYDNKYFYKFSKGFVMSSEINFGFDYSKTEQKTIDQIKKAFDKLIKTPYQTNGKFTFFTEGSREIGKIIYYTTTLGRIEKISVLGFSFDLFDGELIVSVNDKGTITNIDASTTTTTTESPTDAMSGYLADDFEYLDFKDGLYLLAESEGLRPPPDIIPPFDREEKIKELV
jgi:hypothetical protein